MTEKLYLQDPNQLEFTAHVTGRRVIDGRPAVVLDRTCFYPTSGGQPHDRGTLNDVPVIQVLIDDANDEVVHILAGELKNDLVRGRIDQQRRFDHMQQHTGQHILSEAFMHIIGAATVSFHMSEEFSTLDIDRSHLSMGEAHAVEDEANRVVFENRPVITHIVSPQEAGKMPLRKPPTVKGPVRIIEINDHDWSACGGTHCRSSGEVGIIRIIGIERQGNQTRVTFLCGWRALRDYRRKDSILSGIAGYLTTGYTELPEVIRKLDESAHTFQRELHKAQEMLASVEAEGILAQAERVGTTRLVSQVIRDRDFQAVKQLAGRMLQESDVVVLLGWQGPEKGQLLFGRGEKVNLDASALLRQVCQAFGGGGGGRPAQAQGGGMPSSHVPEAVEMARRRVMDQLQVK